MPVHDYVISNATGATIRADLNNALSAIVTNNSSNSEPATKYAYMWWADTSAGLLKIRNSSNDGWVTLFQLDGTLTLEDGTNSAPALSFRDDDNTGIFSSAADNLDITTGGTTRVNVSSTGINVTGTVTDDGASHDGDVTFIGASANINFDKSDNALEFADTSLARFGNSNDLAIYHSGSQSFIQDAGTGGLFILGSRVEIGNSGGSESGLVFTQNGSVDLFHNNVKVFETTSEGGTLTGRLTISDTSPIINFTDTNNDSDFRIQVESGSFIIEDATNSFADRFLIDSNGNIQIPSDSTKLQLGASQSLNIFYDGNSHIDNNNGSLKINTASGNVQINKGTTEFMAVFNVDGAVELYHDNSRKLQTTSAGITVTDVISITDSAGAQRLLMGNQDSAGANCPKILNSGNGILTIGIGDSWSGDGGTLTDQLKVLKDGNIQIPNDNAILQLGASQDLALYHDGSNSHILDNGTGDLRLTTNGAKIDFQKSGGEVLARFITDGAVELYYDNTKRFETSSGGVKVTGDLRINDNEFIYLGDGTDLQINVGSNNDGVINQANGDLKFQRAGAGKFTLKSTGTHFGDDAVWADSQKAIFGDGSDLQIYHDGSNSEIIDNGTGNLNIRTNGTAVAIMAGGGAQIAEFINNGACILRHQTTARLETSSTGVTVTGDVNPTGNLNLPDNSKLQLGNNQDLVIYHDSAHSYIDNALNDLFIRNTSDDIIIQAQDDFFIRVAGGENAVVALDNGAVELYYDNVKKFETLTDGVNVTGTLKINGSAISTGGLGNVVEDTTPQLGGDLQSNGNDIDFADGDKAIFGTDGDLEIYHDSGVNTIIALNGSIFFKGDASNVIGIQPRNGENSALFYPDGAVELYHNGSKKFETTSAGATLTGNLSMPSGNGIDFSAVSDGSRSVSTDGNKLDDYEEGVFTPSLEFGGATTGITYSSMRGGSYTKIGRQVTVNFGFTLTSKGSASGDATIAGLPFAIEDLLSSTTAEASGVSCFWNDIATNSANIVFVAMGGTSELEIRNTVGAEDDTDTMVDGDFGNSTAIRGSITYFTAT